MRDWRDAAREMGAYARGWRWRWEMLRIGADEAATDRKCLRAERDEAVALLRRWHALPMHDHVKSAEAMILESTTARFFALTAHAGDGHQCGARRRVAGAKSNEGEGTG